MSDEKFVALCKKCGLDKLDCINWPIGPVCSSCVWLYTPQAQPKVYGRQTAQPESCRVIVELCHPNAKLPWQASPGDACYDLFAPEDITLDYGETRVIKLGLKIQLEPGWEAQIRGRSSLQAAGLLFTVGTIDERYRKEIGAIVTSLHLKPPPPGFDGNTPSRKPKKPVATRAMIGSPYYIAAGERIAQMAIRRAPAVELVEGPVEPTERGGFGSTGR